MIVKSKDLTLTLTLTLIRYECLLVARQI